jgi:POT family proton-dependent oligopeptide transporter
MKKQDDDSSFAAVNETAHKSDSEKTVSIGSVPHQLNDLGLVAPTEEEMNTLRHVPDNINWTAYSKPSLDFRVLIAPVYL